MCDDNVFKNGNVFVGKLTFESNIKLINDIRDFHGLGPGSQEEIDELRSVWNEKYGHLDGIEPIKDDEDDSTDDGDDVTKDTSKTDEPESE